MSTSAGAEYVYNWWDEHGRDPFAYYVPNEDDRRELEAKIQVAINLAMSHPRDPALPNKPLVEFAKDLKSKYNTTVVWMFYRIAALPDPLTIEAQRVAKIKKENKARRRQQIFDNMTEEEKANYYDELRKRTRATHSGCWSYHDDDCLCGRYFDNTHCSRGDYNWNCCGATSETACCYNGASTVEDPLVVPDDDADDDANH